MSKLVDKYYDDIQVYEEDASILMNNVFFICDGVGGSTITPHFLANMLAQKAVINILKNDYYNTMKTFDIEMFNVNL